MYTRATWGEHAFYMHLCKSYGTKVATAARLCACTAIDEPLSKLVLFSAYPETLDNVVKLLSRSNVNAISSTKVSRQGMAHAIASFSSKSHSGSDSSLRVLLLKLTDESAGANLLLATHIILVDTSSGPGALVDALEKQAVGMGLRQMMGHTPRVLKVVTRQESVRRNLWEDKE
jgi:hypothetical protein